ncbi:hypothetical protein Ptr902_03793 [Pyrenophora tritici-repentis]|nr:hypothetical protein Ptr902_03793 [Pyrenophora tritici-repentis]
MAARSSQEKAPQTVTAMRAHQLLGHPSYQALEHLQDTTTGLKIGTNGKGDPWTDDCIPCIEGKMKEDISRRPRADKACRPFYRISIDIIQLQKHSAVCYNGDVWALHAVCEYTKFHEICTLRSRHKATVVPAIIRLINKIERVYSYQVAIVFMDGDVRVIRVRDVRFIDELYKEKPSTPPVEPRIIETVHIPKEEYDGDTIVVAQPVRQRQEAITTSVLPPDHVSEKEYDGDTIAVYQKPVRQLLSPSPTPAFEGQDRSPSPDPVEQQLLQESSALMDSSPHRTPRGWNNYDDAEIYIPDRHQNNAPQRRDPNLSQDNIITGRRRRQAHYIEAAPDLSNARGGEPTQTFATKVNLSVSTLPTFFGAADASFGDDVETRRSSAGYVFMLYGMPVDWKATVLRSVTRSTTEAELYALSAAGVESQYWDRFCRNIGFTLHTKKALWCDNAQTR